MSVATQEPVSLSPSEQTEVRQFEQQLGPVAPALVGPNGEKLILPAKVYQVFREAVRLMARGQSVTIVPDNQAITTQRAANLLGMSRPFFIRLLDAGAMGHHRVGNQRRVYLRDVLAFAHNRDQEREAALDRLTQDAFAAGLYERNVMPEGGADL